MDRTGFPRRPLPTVGRGATSGVRNQESGVSQDTSCFGALPRPCGFGLSFFGFLLGLRVFAAVEAVHAASVPWRTHVSAAWAAFAMASSTAFRSPGLNFESTWSTASPGPGSPTPIRSRAYASVPSCS